MNERRAVRRVAPEQPLAAKVFASFPVRVLDISERGAQLEVERSLRPNVSCELRFPSPDGELVLRAMVRRCRAWGFALGEGDQRVLMFRAGVEFVNPESDLLHKLRLAAASEGPCEPAAGAPQENLVPGAEMLAGTTEEPPAASASSKEGEGLAGENGAAAGQMGKAVGSPSRGPVKIRIRSDYVRRILQQS